MSFITPKEEQVRFKLETADLLDLDILTVTWETKPEIVEKLLPKPLEPFDTPLVQAYIANFRKTNFGPGYLESALSLICNYKGEIGAYFLAMPVSEGLPMAYGREYFGYPKKTAKVKLKRFFNTVYGCSTRHGIKFLKMRAHFLQTITEEKALEYGMSHDTVVNVFLFKHFVAPSIKEYDYKPRLVKQEVEIHRDVIKVGLGAIKFKVSKYDPWSEVEVVKMLGASFGKGYNKMLPAKVMEEIDPEYLLPYAYTKWDRWE
jgi:acetoacetate decarboxylase